MAAYVIIGNSAAGLEAARTIRELEPDREIVMLSMESIVYSRCMLHKLLAKERTLSSLEFEGLDFFKQHRIRWMPDSEVVTIDEERRILTIADGKELSYEKLLIASGADYFIPPIPNFRDADNVFGFRSLEDLYQIEQALTFFGKRVVIIGGGIIGLDVAYGLRGQGAQVTILEKESRLMPLQTDDYTAGIYAEAFRNAGVTIMTGVAAKDSKMDDDDRIVSVILEEGEEVPCDFVVVATSVKPQMDFLAGTSIQALHVNYHIHTVLSRFLRKTGVQVTKGLEVDPYMETNVPGIYAAGDVTGMSGVWPDACAMGEIAAKNICGIPTRRPDRFVDKNSVNFYGITMISLGKVNADPLVYDIRIHQSEHSYKRLVLRDGYLEGALFMGDLSNAGIYLHLIREHISLAGLEKRLFKLSFGDWYGIDETTGEFVYRLERE